MKKARQKKNTSPPESFEILSKAETGEIQRSTPVVRGAYDRRKVTAPVHDPEIHGPSMVQQHFKEECDINRIILKFTETGFVSHQMPGLPTFGEAPATTFTEAMFIVSEAQETFNGLPAEIRDHFGNDPQAFLDAFNDESQKETLIELGLLESRPPPEAVLVRLEGDMPGAAQASPGADNAAES